ncbi:ABC transporter substrate-binding protein [Bradyrhizobium sp. 146]|uniref:ABC transporter substrate-binding protein n=2 Tax=unclassified Bradyrhizobium TaxID=2631580 RepID=UPI001FF84B2C|nr:ABC transporter substrate-binding protein [Bradyrhizobium sp. 146]MCK1656498.1 ABC transporter substrate-binding protein [Bradyrhizobium sp. 151]MCK1700840.1 ABC transporter substrate-binding protein [Bradyrhizobium sp. 146]
MHRREFISLIGVAVAWNSQSAAYSQTRGKLPLVGVLIPGSADQLNDRLAGLRRGLREAGLVEDRNYALVTRFADGDLSRIPALTQELGELKPVVIVVAAVVNFVHGMLPQMPLVFTSYAADPIASGLAQSYARPGGLVTGNVLNAIGGEEALAAKRMSLFGELVPHVTRIGMLGPLEGLLLEKEKAALKKVGAQLGFEVSNYSLKSIDDLEEAIARGLRDEVSAFYLSGEPMLTINKSRAVPALSKAGRPTVGPYPELARAGILMSYSSDLDDGFRHAGSYVAKILGGTKPSDLPIEQASKFVFAINLKTAKALNIAVPPSLLALADEVIE